MYGYTVYSHCFSTRLNVSPGNFSDSFHSITIALCPFLSMYQNPLPLVCAIRHWYVCTDMRISLPALGCLSYHLNSTNFSSAYLISPEQLPFSLHTHKSAITELWPYLVSLQFLFCHLDTVIWLISPSLHAIRMWLMSRKKNLWTGGYKVWLWRTKK